MEMSGEQLIPVSQAAPAAAGHDEHHAGPVPRDPDLPAVSDASLMFLAAGALVAFVVALFTLYG